MLDLTEYSEKELTLHIINTEEHTKFYISHFNNYWDRQGFFDYLDKFFIYDYEQLENLIDYINSEQEELETA